MIETKRKYIIQHNTYNPFMLILCCMYISFIQGGIWQLVPILNGTIAFGIALLITIVCLTDSFSEKYFLYEQHGYGIILMLLLSFVYTITVEKRLKQSSFLSTYYCFVIMLIGAYTKNKPGFGRILVGYIILEILIKEVINAYELTIDSSIVKYAQFNELSTSSVGFQRMIGVGFLYSIAIMIFIGVANIKLIKRKIVLCLWLLLSGWTIVNASFTLIMFSTAVISLLILFIDSEKMEKNLFVIFLFTAGIVLFLQFIINFAIDNKLFNETILIRLKDVNKMFFGNDTGESLIERYGNESAFSTTSSAQNRMVRYIQSGKAVLHNWLLGYLTPEAYSHGGHSIWLDIFAKYGILVLLYYKSIIEYQKRLFAESGSNQRKILIAFAMFYIILGTVNSFPMLYFYIQLYILIPYTYEMFYKYQTNRLGVEL